MPRAKVVNVEVVCGICGKQYSYTRSDRKGASKQTCGSCNVQKRRRKLKQMALEYKGNCCQICGYNRSVRALHFHHLDPTQKEFGIAARGITWGWESMKAELDKCILVCSNCHMELEDGLISIPS